MLNPRTISYTPDQLMDIRHSIQQYNPTKEISHHFQKAPSDHYLASTKPRIAFDCAGNASKMTSKISKTLQPNYEGFEIPLDISATESEKNNSQILAYVLGGIIVIGILIAFHFHNQQIAKRKVIADGDLD